MPTCEDLATKAELQELRDQINFLLGKREGSTSQINVLQAGSLEGTAIAGTLALAATAIQNLVVSGNVGNNFVGAIASGAAKFEAVKGNGVKVAVDGITNIAKGVGKNASKIGTLLTASTVSGGTLSIVLALVSQIANTGLLIGTLNLIKQNTKNNEFAFESLSRDYSTMMGFISNQRADIQAVEQANEDNAIAFGQQSAINIDQANQLAEQEAAISGLRQVNDEQNSQISQANSAITALQVQAEALEEDAENFKEEMLTLTGQFETALTQAEAVNTKQSETIETINAEIDLINQEIDGIETEIRNINLRADLFRGEFLQLRYDLEGDHELRDIRAKLLEAQVIVAQDRAKRESLAGGGAAVGIRGAADAQNGVLDIARGLAGVEEENEPLTADDIRNNTTTFADRLTDLLSRANTGEAVREGDIQNIRDGVKADMGLLIPALLGATVIPSLNTLQSQTAAPAIASAAAAGVCSTTAPGGCMNTNVTQPLQNQLGGMINAAGTAFSAANNALLLQMQAAIAAMSGTVTTIASVTNTTMGVVTHATYGLQAIQNFASTAWKATRADKILAGISMALTVHNAMMLSNNLLLTMSEATNMALDALGIRDETDSPIDFSRMVKDKIASVLTSILGAEQYAALTARIAKANRIYQASVNVLDTTQALFDSARSVAELTAENTGKIGNALRESGAVYEDAYEEFAERINPQNRAQRNLEKFRGSIEGVSEVFETIEGISSNIVEFQETAVQLKEEKEEWKTELDTEIEVKVTEKTEAKEGLQVDADIQKVDFGKAEAEE